MLDEASARWARLAVGESMTLMWRNVTKQRTHRRGT
jgi:hypothetical protein